MPTLKLSLLGPPQIELDGAPVHISRHKAVALLAYLAVTGQTHRRDALAALFWPEHDQSGARAGLRRVLAALREALGERWLDADRESVVLNGEIDLDVRAFRQRLTGCADHRHAPQEACEAQEACAACLSLLAEGVALYRGDFLAGFSLRDSAAFDDWQFFQTQGLRDELAHALQRLVEGHAAQGAFDRAIPHARRWLALDPQHEPARRALMALYARAGQHAAALRQYEACERILQEELGVPPSAETTALYQAIKERRELPDPVARNPVSAQRKHNLPAQVTTFVGREALLAEIGERLADPACRLLTLVGPGGSGKTRLALEAASRRLDGYEHGIFFVSLAPLDAVESIVPAVAQALAFSFHGEGEPKAQLLAYLRNKQILLILDNYEHLLSPTLPSPPLGGIEGGIEPVTDILHTAPDVHILVTSRSRLSVRGESIFPIEGMDVPSLPSPGSEPQLHGRGTTGGVRRRGEGDYSAVKLFLDGARRAQPGFGLTEENVADVVRICRLVEGMPLGILLAAAWAGTLTPAEIAAEIEHGLDFLTSDWRDMPARQRSVRAVFDHSWSLLTAQQREVSKALSAFRGGFTRWAAERVVGASLRDVTALVDRSLLHHMPGGRYEVHELVRQYAAEKLAESPRISAFSIASGMSST